ncbi:C-8 sterol isomerase [Blastomyces parvus]|uniref:C-8 sterol isomerase n=1 Tax=Blastomyces parvus TaxID=2060905 RepID=A0A2B7XLN7_9EURO|nr:C-8 sterol isomerase [Blastomyces parvus]
MRFLAFLPLLLVGLYKLDQALPRFYIFDPQRLQELSKASIERHPNNVTELMTDLNQALRQEYGEKHVLPFDQDPTRWVFSNHGSAMGAMIILHASLTEYLIFYGTPLGTEGHSGVHLADDYFTILQGVERRFMPGELEATEYFPGDQNWLKRGTVSQYQMQGWALELAQGWIPSMLPFGFLDTFTSTLDFVNLWQTVYLTAKAMGQQLLIGKF